MLPFLCNHSVNNPLLIGREHQPKIPIPDMQSPGIGEGNSPREPPSEEGSDTAATVDLDQEIDVDLGEDKLNGPGLSIRGRVSR